MQKRIMPIVERSLRKTLGDRSDVARVIEDDGSIDPFTPHIRATTLDGKI